MSLSFFFISLFFIFYQKVFLPDHKLIRYQAFGANFRYLSVIYLHGNSELLLTQGQLPCS